MTMITSEKIRVALVHATLNAIGPLNETFARSYPEVEIINLLDEGLLLAINEQGGVNAALLERFVDLIHKAIDSRAQGVLASCSSFSPWIPQIQQHFDVPLLSVDEAMLKQAIDLSSQIGVVATVAAAGPTTRGELKRIAQMRGKEGEVHVEVVTEAMDALKKGDTLQHDILIRERAEKLVAKGTEVIVLAQISMARTASALENVGVPILTSPGSSANAIMQAVAERGNVPISWAGATWYRSVKEAEPPMS